jgi:hypothetical protein
MRVLPLHFSKKPVIAFSRAPWMIVLPLLVLAAGCARVSPAVGTWTGKRRPQTATLTLRPDGTGTLQPPIGAQQPVSWTEKEGAVALKLGGGAAAGAGGGAAGARGGNGSGGSGGMSVDVPGTLSEDGKTMTVPLGPLSLTLQKQESAK